MKAFQGLLFIAVSVLLPLSQALAKAPPRLGSFYADGHGGFVYFPLGNASFADRVVSYTAGKPAPRHAKDRQPSNALAAPDYNPKTETGYLTLGCGGTLVLRFSDNALVDVDGPDLHIFEIGASIEPTRLAISVDGRQWVEIGSIAGGRADVDIRPVAKKGESFSFVRLVDLKKDCGRGTPGADIDAVGAIGSGMRLRIGSEVLFDSGKATLRPEAEAELQAVSAQINSMNNVSIIVEGHTDSVGSDLANQLLSEQRAGSVRAYLQQHVQGHKLAITDRGFGEKSPIAGNDTDVGRRKNRRVELIVIPSGQAGAEKPLSAFDGMWNTDEGLMVLAAYSAGRKVVGRYATDNGRVFLSVSQKHLSGYWVEDKSSQKCDSKRHQSAYWGRLEIDLDESNNSFSGWWNYCDSGGRQGLWNGKREAAGQH
jgi:outer membrane protein OmpA-like peptidoglycan-associated protein